MAYKQSQEEKTKTLGYFLIVIAIILLFVCPQIILIPLVLFGLAYMLFKTLKLMN